MSVRFAETTNATFTQRPSGGLEQVRMVAVYRRPRAHRGGTNSTEEQHYDPSEDEQQRPDPLRSGAPLVGPMPFPA
jgi:hypothetical protein